MHARTCMELLDLRVQCCVIARLFGLEKQEYHQYWRRPALCSFWPCATVCRWSDRFTGQPLACASTAKQSAIAHLGHCGESPRLPSQPRRLTKHFVTPLRSGSEAKRRPSVPAAPPGLSPAGTSCSADASLDGRTAVNRAGSSTRGSRLHGPPSEQRTVSIQAVPADSSATQQSDGGRAEASVRPAASRRSGGHRAADTGAHHGAVRRVRLLV